MYRERYGPGTIFIASVRGNRIHDSIKGWGTISKTGKTILWDTYPKPKRKKYKKLTPEQEKAELLALREKFSKFVGPNILSVTKFPILPDLFAVQPMNPKI